MLLIHTHVWGGEPPQICLSCHPAHYMEQGRCPDCHRGNPYSDRKNIAHAGLISAKYAFFSLSDQPHVKNGNRLIDQYSCRRCHVIDRRGNRLAITLDGAAAGKTAEELAGSIRRPVDNMPNFGMDEVRITYLVNSILAGSQRRNTHEGAPVTVHFNIANKKGGDVFSIKCGSCHSLLSEKRGALGIGKIGPNLSGLLSTYYPKTFRNGEAWTFRNLESWLTNPREIRPWARMIPIKLTMEEREGLESIIQLSLNPEK